jgi:hypothetical protein
MPLGAVARLADRDEDSCEDHDRRAGQLPPGEALWIVSLPA